MVYQITRTAWPLSGGVQTYTMGPGGDWDTTRPDRIEHASILSNTTPQKELPLDLRTVQQWQERAVKSTSSSLPREVYIDGGFPLRSLSFFPLPNQVLSAVLYAWQPFAEFADLTTAYCFPPAYLLALRWGLADALGPEMTFYMKSPNVLLPKIATMAVEAKERIKALNVPILDLGVDDALRNSDSRAFNWLTGDTV